jgi:homoaconitase/3-isopropylmalate dehydratase large subunit
MKKGCEQAGTTEMNAEECLVFIDTALQNGSTANEAIQDMRMIDAMVSISKLHMIVFPHVRKTGRGYSRKAMGFRDQLERILEARIDNAFDY